MILLNTSVREFVKTQIEKLLEYQVLTITPQQISQF